MKFDWLCKKMSSLDCSMLSLYTYASIGYFASIFLTYSLHLALSFITSSR